MSYDSLIFIFQISRLKHLSISFWIVFTLFISIQIPCGVGGILSDSQCNRIKDRLEYMAEQDLSIVVNSLHTMLKGIDRSHNNIIALRRLIEEVDEMAKASTISKCLRIKTIIIEVLDPVLQRLESDSPEQSKTKEVPNSITSWCRFNGTADRDWRIGYWRNPVFKPDTLKSLIGMLNNDFNPQPLDTQAERILKFMPSLDALNNTLENRTLLKEILECFGRNEYIDSMLSETFRNCLDQFQVQIGKETIPDKCDLYTGFSGLNYEEEIGAAGGLSADEVEWQQFNDRCGKGTSTPSQSDNIEEVGTCYGTPFCKMSSETADSKIKLEPHAVMHYIRVNGRPQEILSMLEKSNDRWEQAEKLLDFVSEIDSLDNTFQNYQILSHILDNLKKKQILNDTFSGPIEDKIDICLAAHQSLLQIQQTEFKGEEKGFFNSSDKAVEDFSFSMDLSCNSDSISQKLNIPHITSATPKYVAEIAHEFLSFFHIRKNRINKEIRFFIRTNIQEYIDKHVPKPVIDNALALANQFYLFHIKPRGETNPFFDEFFNKLILETHPRGRFEFYCVSPITRALLAVRNYQDARGEDFNDQRKAERTGVDPSIEKKIKTLTNDILSVLEYTVQKYAQIDIKGVTEKKKATCALPFNMMLDFIKKLPDLYVQLNMLSKADDETNYPCHAITPIVWLDLLMAFKDAIPRACGGNSDNYKYHQCIWESLSESLTSKACPGNKTVVPVNREDFDKTVDLINKGYGDWCILGYFLGLGDYIRVTCRDDLVDGLNTTPNHIKALRAIDYYVALSNTFCISATEINNKEYWSGVGQTPFYCKSLLIKHVIGYVFGSDDIHCPSLPMGGLSCFRYYTPDVKICPICLGELYSLIGANGEREFGKAIVIDCPCHTPVHAVCLNRSIQSFDSNLFRFRCFMCNNHLTTNTYRAFAGEDDESGAEGDLEDFIYDMK